MTPEEYLSRVDGLPHDKSAGSTATVATGALVKVMAFIGALAVWLLIGFCGYYIGRTVDMATCRDPSKRLSANVVITGPVVLAAAVISAIDVGITRSDCVSATD